MTTSSTGRLTAERDGPLGWITFDNPARRNAMSMSMWRDLADRVRELDADAAVRVLVLRGAGDRAFVSGADISEFEQQRSSAATSRIYNEAAQRATEALARCGKPTIAMIRGYCIGGGVTVAASCDLRFADDGARFAVPAARLGLGYAYAGVRTLVELVGPAYAKEIFFTARQFSAPEASAMGLVNRVVAGGELEPFVRECARSIADNAPLTVSAIKTLVAQALADEQERDEALCQAVVDRCFDSRDYAEGRAAFMDKRKPVFEGR